MSLADRIREAMGEMSPADLARAAEVTPASVTFWLDGTTKSLKAEKAAKIEAATGYRATWIVTGKGPKKLEQEPHRSLMEYRNPNAYFVPPPPPAYGMEPILAWEHPDDLPEGEFVMVPRLDVHLSAGGGREQVEIDLVKDNPQAFRSEWIRLMKLKPAKLAAMRASGESMEPTIHDGDSLLVDTSQISVQDGKVYALWYDGGERVKRLFRLPGGGLRIASDNRNHQTIEVGPDHQEHVRIIGRVVHRSGTGGL